jgi:translocation and assembly module TamB
MSGPPATPGFLRALRGVGTVLGIALTFAVALASGVLLHLDLPAARQFAARELNRVLLTQFKGKITVEHVAALHAYGVGGLDVRILAADGTTVIAARGVRARIHPVALAQSILRGRGDLDVGVFDIDVQFLDVCLDATEDGTLKLQTAFDLLNPSSPTGGGRTLRLAFQDVAVRRAFVHGQMKGLPAIDADLEGLRGTVRVEPKEVAVDVSHVALVARGMPQGANPRGDVEAHVVVPSKTGRSVGLDTSFGGSVGGIPAVAKATIDGDRVDAVLDVPEVGDEIVRALVARLPLYQPAAAHAEVHGDFASMRTTALVTIGAAELRAAGDLDVATTFVATMGIDATNVDLRAFSRAAPASRVAFHADVRVDTAPNRMLAGRFTVAVPAGGEIAGEFVPPGVFRGDFDQKASSPGNPGGASVEVNLQGLVSEPGAPTDIHANLRTDGPSPVVRFDATSRVARLADLKRVRGLGSGNARFRVEGTLTLAPTPSFDATLVGDVVGLEQAPVRVDRAQLMAHGFGPFARPTVNATIDADGASASRYKIQHARVTTEGPLSAERVTLSLRGDGGPSLRASATVGLSAGSLRFEDAEVEASRGTQTLHATVTQVVVQSGDLNVAGARITGIGEPIRASLDTRRGSLLVRASSKGVDLQALAYLLGIEDRLKKGLLSFAVDLAARDDGAEGSATVDLTHGGFASLDEVSGHIETRMEGRKVTGVMKASVSGLGTLEVTRSHVQVGGNGPLEAGWWRRSWGALSIQGQVDLAKTAELLPPNTLPFSELTGQLTLQGHIKRNNESDMNPDFAFTLKTSGLRLAPRLGAEEKRGTTTMAAAPPWSMSGIDAQLDVRSEGDNGFAEMAARLVDREGSLVSLDAKSAALPYGPLLASSDEAMELLKDVRFSALILVPSRKLDRLPEILRPDGAGGDVEARISIEGTARKPAILLDAKAHAVKFDRSPISRKLDADVTAKYDGAASDIVVDARSSGKDGKDVLHATAHANATAADIMAGKASAFPWDASAKVTFMQFPLGAIAALSNRQVRGQVSGHVELTDLHKDARAAVDLDLAKLRVGTETFDAGKLKVSCNGHTLEASAELEKAGAVASANAKMAVNWGMEMAPAVDPSGAVAAAFQAKHFPAAVLAPFAEGVLDELEGTIDADARFSLSPNEKPKMDGVITFSDGLVEIVALGQELHAVRTQVRFTPDGVVRLEGLSASGTTGKLTASGVARFDGLNVVGADAVLDVTQGDAMPLAVQGAPVGTVYGHLDMKAATSPDRKAVNLKIDVPSLHVELPQVSTHSVQGLDEASPQTHVGVYASAGKFVVLPLDGFDALEESEGTPPVSHTVTIDVHLGHNIEIQRGTDLKIEMEGDLAANVGQKTEVTGRIVLKGGKLDVRGKPFEIESGTATFVGDPSNPEVRVTATWTAEDGTRVFAEYGGPLKTGKVVLRSEPARPQNEILALILFGTADSSQGTAGGTTQAGTTVGGFATEGLTQGLDKLTGMDIVAKIDTSQGNPRPEVAVQIARDISLQLAFVLGNPPPGTNPDTTYATIDWRFHKNWSLETTFGNLGSSIADIVWQHRY